MAPDPFTSSVAARAAEFNVKRCKPVHNTIIKIEFQLNRLKSPNIKPTFTGFAVQVDQCTKP